MNVKRPVPKKPKLVSAFKLVPGRVYQKYLGESVTQINLYHCVRLMDGSLTMIDLEQSVQVRVTGIDEYVEVHGEFVVAGE